MAISITTFSFSSFADESSDVTFHVYTHIQDYGQTTFSEDEWAGTRSESKRLESIAITPLYPNIGSWPSCLGLSYMGHIQDHGDTGWYDAPNKLGTEGKSLRIEGLAFKTTGTCANDYTVKYSCHVQNYGDIGEKSDGEYCGFRGSGLRLEAVKLTVHSK